MTIDSNYDQGNGTQPVFKLPYVGESSETESKKDWTSIDKILLQDNNFVKPEDKFTDKNANMSFERIIAMYNFNQNIPEFQFKMYNTQEHNGVKTIVYTRDRDGTLDTLMMASSTKDGIYTEDMAAFSVENNEELAKNAINAWVNEKSGHCDWMYSKIYQYVGLSLLGLSSYPLVFKLVASIDSVIVLPISLCVIAASCLAGAYGGLQLDNIRTRKLTKKLTDTYSAALTQLRIDGKVVEGAEAVDTIRQIGMNTALNNE